MHMYAAHACLYIEKMGITSSQGTAFGALFTLSSPSSAATIIIYAAHTLHNTRRDIYDAHQLYEYKKDLAAD